MFKRSIIVIILLLTAIISISGCTTKTATNGTFGEKFISVNSIYLSNNATADNYSYNGTEYYEIEGYLVNNNPYDAFNVIVNSTAYNANGSVVATNNSAYLDPTIIPLMVHLIFMWNLMILIQKIVRYDVKVINATSTYG